MTTLQAGAATDVGRVRQINEDRYLSDDDVFAVADGVGGHQAGEIASQTSVETLRREFTDRTTAGLVAAVQAANKAVWELAQGSREKRGMGTTMTAVALVTEDGEEQLAVVNVGDSRAYLLQHGELVQLTEDHSLVEELVREGKLTAAEAQVHPQRSIITRALGMEPAIEVDSWQLIPYRGDRLLLCSDGLTNEVSVEKIASTLRQLADPQEAASDLVRQARASGGSDNITVVVVDVVDDDGRSQRASAALAGGHSPQRPTRNPSTDAGRAPDTERNPARGRVAAPPAPPAPPPTPSAPPAPVARGRAASGGADRVRARRFTWRVAVFLVAVLGVLGVAAYAVGWYARSAYYVGLDGDQVAIFRGRPGGLLWFDPTLVERKAQPAGSELLPAQRTELQAGHEVSSKKAADRFVNNLRQEVESRRAPPTSLPGATTLVPTTVP